LKHTDQLKADFDLSQAQYTMNRLNHEITMLQIDYRDQLTRGGGGKHTPLAVHLESWIRAKQKDLVAAGERVSQLRAERFAQKGPPPLKKLDIDHIVGGPYIPRSD
jgi:hypothetical protein